MSKVVDPDHVAAIERALSDASKQIQKQDGEIGTYQRLNRKKQKELDELRTSLTTVTAELARTKEAATWIESIAARKRELTDAQKEFAAIKADSARLIVHLQHLVNNDTVQRDLIKQALIVEKDRYEQTKAEAEAVRQMTDDLVKKTALVEQEASLLRLRLAQTRLEFEREKAEHDRIEKEHEQALARYEVLYANEDRLKQLSNRIPEIKDKIAEIEARITHKGLLAESLESTLEVRIQEDTALSLSILSSLRAEVVEVLRTAQDLDTQLLKSQEEYVEARSLRDDRVEALRLYYEADKAITENPIILAHCRDGSDVTAVLNVIETMLQGVDRALESAIKANEAAQTLKLLGPRIPY